MEMRDKEQAWKEERTKRQDDSKSRRQAMQELELSRKKHEKPSDLEQVLWRKFLKGVSMMV